MSKTKSLYTKKLGIEVAKEAHPTTSGRYHVITAERKRWTVVAEGRIQAARAFSSQKKAVDFAKQSASKKAEK